MLLVALGGWLIEWCRCRLVVRLRESERDRRIAAERLTEAWKAQLMAERDENLAFLRETDALLRTICQNAGVRLDGDDRPTVVH